MFIDLKKRSFNCVTTAVLKPRNCIKKLTHLMTFWLTTDVTGHDLGPWLGSKIFPVLLTTFTGRVFNLDMYGSTECVG